MKVWDRRRLLGTCGSHLHSCWNARIQVTEVYNKRLPLWTIPNGNLLINVLEGTCYLDEGESLHTLETGEQAFLNEGESFNLFSKSESEVVVQMIWMPGIGDE